MLCLANMETGKLLTIHIEKIHSINKQGRKNWRKQSGYHRRSLAETAMFRIKTLFDDRLHARLLNTQATEVLIRCKV